MNLLTIYEEGLHRVVIRNETRMSLTILATDERVYVVEPMIVRHLTDIVIKEIHFKRVQTDADSSDL